MKKLWNSFKIAFAMYSKIPMPQSEWTEENMSYAMCFFPWVGAVTGGMSYLVVLFADLLKEREISFGSLFFPVVLTVLPVLISGGIHMDGFLDVTDARSSFQSRERKLEILKDSHIGAFAVIMTVLYVLIAAGAYSEIKNYSVMASFCGSYFLSRIFSAIAVVSFPCAKKEGTLYMFADAAQEKIVKRSLYAELALCALWQILMDPKAGIMQLICALTVFGYYYYKSKKEFGGITGDLAGYFVTLCEGALMVMAAIACL